MNSTVKLQEICDDAASLGDTAPALATGGVSDGPALSMATDVMAAMINGGPGGVPYNWKWNRFNAPAFPTISYQQDNFIPGLVNLGWIESAWASNINQTSIPKQKQQLEVHRDLLVTYDQTGWPGKICWIPNSVAQTGTWGAAPLGPTAGNPSGNTTSIGSNPSGIQNPGPGVIYTNPLGIPNQPINATTCIKDPNGNLWVLTTYGTCGSVQPTWPTNPVFPAFNNQNVVATTVTDGTVVWTAVNPAGMAFRLNPIPPQTGTCWLIQPVCQFKAPRFTSLAQYLEPIPDDFSTYFKQGFFAECYRRNPDQKVRSKYTMERQLFLEALDRSVKQADREQDDMGFYPGMSIMETGVAVNPINPANPFGNYGSY